MKEVEKEVELVIRLPEKMYDTIVKMFSTFPADMKEWGLRAIKNGDRLPEDHGRLGDLDALEKEMEGGINAGLMMDGYEDYPHINDTDDCLECVKYADTLIKANYPVPIKEESKDRDDDFER